jgi:hypothetical protein
MIEHLVPPRECLSLPSPAPLTSLDRAPELGLSPYRGMLASMVALELGETAECLVVAARYYASVLVLTSLVRRAGALRRVDIWRETLVRSAARVTGARLRCPMG